VWKAIGDLSNETEAYWNWKKAGGAGGAFIDIKAEYAQKELSKVD
jgi:hypothetical protein